MKNFLDRFLLMLILLNSCDGLFIRDCGCVPIPYRSELVIALRKIKNPSVKSIKVTVKNLDGIKPEFDYKSITEQKRSKSAIVITSLGPPKETYSYYFKGINVIFVPPPCERQCFINKKRVYELKTYINDKLFFIKKISFIPKETGKGYLYSDKVEVDNMEYVKEISSDFRPDWNWLIEITDADIKE